MKRSGPIKRTKALKRAPFRRKKPSSKFGYPHWGRRLPPDDVTAAQAQAEAARAEVERQQAAFPKDVRVEDRDYLDWLRRQRCQFCPRKPPNQAHHTILKGMGGATLRDDMAVTACERCHRRCHHTETPHIDREVQEFTAKRQRAQFLLWLQTKPEGIPS